MLVRKLQILPRHGQAALLQPTHHGFALVYPRGRFAAAPLRHRPEEAVLPGAQPKLQQAVADRGIDARRSERILIQIQDGDPVSPGRRQDQPRIGIEHALRRVIEKAPSSSSSFNSSESEADSAAFSTCSASIPA